MITGAREIRPMARIGTIGGHQHWCLPVIIDDRVIQAIASEPRRWRPFSPDYQKAETWRHTSPAPISVRSWFRKMRAAEFKRQLVEIGLLVVPVDHWTLFDTQKVVDRATAHVCVCGAMPFAGDGFGNVPWFTSDRWRRL